MNEEYIKRQQDRYVRNIKKASGICLEQIGETAVADLSPDYFTQRLKRIFVDLEEMNTPPAIGMYCAMAPEELVLALGYLPLKLCGNTMTAALAGEDYSPRDACPVVKASIGFQVMKVTPMMNNLKAVVVLGSCDGKKKAAEILSEFVPTIPVPIYMSKNNEGFEALVETFHGLIMTLEQITGRKITAGKLKKACNEISNASREAYKLYEILKTDRCAVSGTQVMAIMSAYAYDSPGRWASELKKFNRRAILTESYPVKRKRPEVKIMIAGSPIGFPNFKLPWLLETLGARIVTDENCLAGRLLYDPVLPDDDSLNGLVRALAARYVAPCTCPTFIEMEDRFFRFEHMMKISGADGIIYHVLKGCIPYDFELNYIEKWSREKNISVLRVESDLGTEDYESLKIRLEAFIEMLERR